MQLAPTQCSINLHTLWWCTCSVVVVVLLPPTSTQVKMWQGSGNPWKTNTTNSLGPWDELRVSYVNAWTAAPGSAGLQASTTLELLPDRVPLDLSDFLQVSVPIWAFRAIPGAASNNTTGVLRYRADLVLTASRASFGGKRLRRMLLAESIMRAFSPRKLAPGTSAAAAAPQPLNLASITSTPSNAQSCSTNSRPQQQCPVGWDAVNKLVKPADVTPAVTPMVAATAAAATATGSRQQQHRMQQRKGPSRVPGTVSSLLSAGTAAPAGKGQASAMSSAAVGTVAAVGGGASSSNDSTSAFCAGSALVRPVSIEYGILKPFNPELDGAGDWQYHAGIDFAVPADINIFVSHDGFIATAGNDPSLGNYVVSLAWQSSDQRALPSWQTV